MAQTLSQAREIETHLRESLIREKYLGNSIGNKDYTFKDFFLKQYLPWVKTNLKDSSKHESFFKNWLNPHLGTKKLNEITVQDVEALKTAVISSGKSPRTVQHILAILKASLNKAKDWDLLTGDNPVSKMKCPKFDNRRVGFLSPEEAKVLLEECRRRTTPDNRIYQIVLLALTTGMRAGEIFHLKCQDVDFENDLTHVRDPKSGENRTVFLSPEVKAELLHLTEGKRPHDYVFTNSKNKPFKGVPDVWKGIIKRLGFNEGVTDRREKVVFHAEAYLLFMAGHFRHSPACNQRACRA